MIPTVASALSILALLACQTTAAPVTNEGVRIPLSKRHVGRRNDGKADMAWIEATNAKVAHKYHATLTAYEKNTGSPLPGTSSASARRAMLKRQYEGLTDEQGGSFWEGQISIGTPAQNFNMDFDTGSSDLWVPTSQAGTSGNTYNPGASSTAQDQGRTFTVSYGDGSSTSGEVYTDTVTIAGETATNQGVGAASQVSSTTGASFDGLVGMAYQTLSNEQESPFFDTLYNEGVVSTGQFSFALTESGAELYLGGTDSSKYSGSISFTPVTQQAYWQVNLDAATVNGNTVKSNVGAIIDTGTTLIYAPSADVDNLFQSYPGALPYSDFSSQSQDGYWAVPCSGPSYVAFNFGGSAFEISTAAMTNQGSVGYSNGQEYCLASIMGNDNLGLGGAWLVGDAFLTNVYAVFDIVNNQVGFADLA